MNLVLAILWLAGGVGLLAYQAATGDKVLYIRGTNLSLGWLLLLLALYNLARWFSVRSYLAEQRALQAARAGQERDRHRHEPPGEPDPNFQFTDEPAPPAG